MAQASPEKRPGLAPLDYIVVGAYLTLVILVAVGATLWKRYQGRVRAICASESQQRAVERSTAGRAAGVQEPRLNASDKVSDEPEDFFLADRAAPWWIVAASFFASNIGTDAIVGLSSAGASVGLAASSFDLASALAFLALAYAFLPAYRASGVYTLPEWAEARFGRRVRVYLAAVSLALYALAKVSVALYCGSLVLAFVTGASPWAGVGALLALTAVFSVTGGLRAVLAVEVWNTGLLLVGGAVASAVAVSAAGGFHGLMASLRSGTDATALAAGMTPSMTHLAQPQGAPYALPALLVGTPWLILWFHCGDQEMVQRGLSGASDAHARLGSVLAGWLKLTVPWTWALPGLAARFLFPRDLGCPPLPAGGGGTGNATIQGGHANGGITGGHIPQDLATGTAAYDLNARPTACLQPNYAYPVLMTKLLPSGLSGALLAACLAGVLSVLASTLNSASTLATMDVMRIVARDMAIPVKERDGGHGGHSHGSHGGHDGHDEAVAWDVATSPKDKCSAGSTSSEDEAGNVHEDTKVLSAREARTGVHEPRPGPEPDSDGGPEHVADDTAPLVPQVVDTASADAGPGTATGSGAAEVLATDDGPVTDARVHEAGQDLHNQPRQPPHGPLPWLYAGGQAFWQQLRHACEALASGTRTNRAFSLLQRASGAIARACSCTVPYNPRLSQLLLKPHNLVWAGRIFILLLVCVSLIWLPVLPKLAPSLYTAMQSLNAYIAPPVAVVFTAGLLWPGATETGALACLAFGHALGAARLILELSGVGEPLPAPVPEPQPVPQPKPSTGKAAVAVAYALLARPDFLYFAAASGAISTILMIFFSLRTKRRDRLPLAKVGPLTAPFALRASCAWFRLRARLLSALGHQGAAMGLREAADEYQRLLVALADRNAAPCAACGRRLRVQLPPSEVPDTHASADYVALNSTTAEGKAAFSGASKAGPVEEESSPGLFTPVQTAGEGVTNADGHATATGAAAKANPMAQRDSAEHAAVPAVSAATADEDTAQDARARAYAPYRDDHDEAEVLVRSPGGRVTAVLPEQLSTDTAGHIQPHQVHHHHHLGDAQAHHGDGQARIPGASAVRVRPAVDGPSDDLVAHDTDVDAEVCITPAGQHSRSPSRRYDSRGSTRRGSRGSRGLSINGLSVDVRYDDAHPGLRGDEARDVSTDSAAASGGMFGGEHLGACDLSPLHDSAWPGPGDVEPCGEGHCGDVGPGQLCPSDAACKAAAAAEKRMNAVADIAAVGLIAAVVAIAAAVW